MDRLSQVRAVAGLRAEKPLQTDNDSIYTPPDNGDNFRRRNVVVSFILPVNEVDKNAADTLDAFFKDIDEVKGVIAAMQELTVELRRKHTGNLQTIDQNATRQLRSEINELSDSCNEKASFVKGKLDAMNKKTETMKETQEALEANSAVVRIQENQYRYLLSKFMHIMEVYRRLQIVSEAAYKEHTKRQIKIMYKNSKNTEIDDTAAEELAQQVLDNNLNNYIFQQSKEVLAMVIESRNDIYRIENSMRELNRIFNDMAILVEEQGELMDVILTNIKNSARYVETSLSELKKARKLQKKVNKKLICIIAIVVVVLLLFTLIIIASTISV